jgi:hypothetical protein
MSLRNAVIGVAAVVLSGALTMAAPRAHAEDDDKKPLAEAKRKLKDATAETKQAAQSAVEAAEEGAEAAKQEVVGSMQKARGSLERAGEKAEDATDQVVGKAGRIKTDVVAATAQAKQEAELAVDQAGKTIHQMEASARQLVRDAVGATNDNARLRTARRAAWRQLASDVDKPQSLAPNVREELRRHAQRVARLQRIRKLASEKPDAAVVARADKLLELENARHQKKLQLFMAGVRAKRQTNDRIAAANEDPDPAEDTVEEEEEPQP